MGAVYTPLADLGSVLVTSSKWNELLGANGNMAYLKERTDNPLIGTLNSGSAEAAAEGINIIEGTNIVAEVEYNGSTGMLDITLSASGGSVPTLGTDVSPLVTLTDPGSYPNWSAWSELIAATAAESLALSISIMSMAVARYQIGTGASPTAVYDWQIIMSATATLNPFTIPFKITAGTKISARAYYISAVTTKIAITVLS